MNSNQYNIQFDKLCDSLRLGNIISAPRALTGGLLHRMYRVETTLGRYAIKALNPQVMSRTIAIQRYKESERISNMAANSIPALSAKRVDGNFIHQVDNQFYLVFDWVDGISLKPYEINLVHCEKIGAILADIHTTDFSELGISDSWTDNVQLIDWNYYLQKGQVNNSVWANLLFENIDKLYTWNAQANESKRLLVSDRVISHRDLDPKNVIWIQNNPIIIDWESAGYANPMQELTETAICWSEDEAGIINKEKFLAFIRGYKKKYGALQAKWRMILLSGFLGKLGWLEYSLKRSLMIECTDEDEQHMGTTQVIETIGVIIRYADMLSEIEEWLCDIVR